MEWIKICGELIKAEKAKEFFNHLETTLGIISTNKL